MIPLLLLALAAPPTLTHLYPAGAGQGTSVTVTLGGTFERWPVGVWVEGTGIAARAEKLKGRVSLTVAADATPGPRWLRIHDAQGASVPRRFMVGTLPEVSEKEPNDTKPQPVPDGVVVNGRLEKSGDVDAYTVKLKKGQMLTASVAADRWLGSPMDGVLQVVSPRGFVLAQSNDHAGLDPHLAFPAPEDGSYAVRLFAFPAVPDSSIRFAGGERFIYRLTLTTGPFLDHAWPLSQPRGKADAVEVDSDTGVVFQKGAGGFGLVRLEPHPCVEFGKQTVTAPVTVSGRLATPGEKHVHAVEGRKGQRMEAVVESASAGFAVDPVVRVMDPAGKVLARAQAARLHLDVQAAVTLPADGVYRVEVSDLRGEAGPRHLYRLRLLDGTPDFSVTIKDDRFTLAAGKTIDVPVTVTRRNGAKAVTLAAEGLPAGVTAEATKAGLRLKAGPGAKSGPFLIVGTGHGVKRAARATLTDPAATVERLWVTVTGK